MITLSNLLNFKVFKNNKLIIDKNNIAYSKKFDKILFESDNNKYQLEINNSYYLTKENSESLINIIFKDKPKCSIYLKEYNLSLAVIVEDYKVLKEDNKYTFIYQLETDDEQTTIEIEL